MSACESVHMSAGAQSTTGSRLPGTAATDGWELPDVTAGTELVSLEEQQVLLILNISPVPPFYPLLKLLPICLSLVF